jgi:hypothetical protein
VNETTTVQMIKKRREKIRKLVYNGEDNMPDGDISSKMRDIRDLTSLKSILMHRCYKITDEGMGIIGDSLRHLTLLTSTTLDFEG